MRPLFSDPPVQASGQPVSAAPVSSLASALMQPRQMPRERSALEQVPLASLMQLLKAGQTGAPTYGNPNGMPSMGAGMSPEVLAAQMGSNMQIGQPGASISGMPQQTDWGWLGRLFGG